MDQQQILLSRHLLQTQHDQGACQCLEVPFRECLFLPNLDPYDDGADQQEEADAEWNPLLGYLQHPGLVYTLEDILFPVLNYLQGQRQVNDRALTLQDVTPADVTFFYDNVWNRD